MAHLELLYWLLLSFRVITMRLPKALLMEFSLAFTEPSMELVPLALYVRLDDVDGCLHQLVSLSLRVLQDALHFACVPAADCLRL